MVGYDELIVDCEGQECGDEKNQYQVCDCY